MNERVVGVILAGGVSRRFGSPKAFADVDGIPFYQFSLEALQPIADTIVIVTNEQLEKKFIETTSVRVIKDEDNFKGKGPLAGIYSAMQSIQADWYALAPVDVPFIQSEVFHRLLEQREVDKEAIVPVTNERLQSLIAIYHYSLKGRIKGLLETDHLAMRDLLNISKVKYALFTDETTFININLTRDYNRYIRDRGMDEYA